MKAKKWDKNMYQYVIKIVWLSKDEQGMIPMMLAPSAPKV